MQRLELGYLKTFLTLESALQGPGIHHNILTSWFAGQTPPNECLPAFFDSCAVLYKTCHFGIFPEAMIH